jgi:tRNA A-37 threonylcarbamoyl transferase component Bud32/tetratricopeptide (TPR) repeat protein
MGVVYEALDRERGEVVALKTLLHYDAAALYRFKQEFRTLAGVHHVNLVHLHELVVTDAGDAFFTMELLRGTGFLRYVRPDSRPPSIPASGVVAVDRADRDTIRPVATPTASVPSKRMTANEDRLRSSLRQLAQGVNALHAAGKLHRDIKPSNVVVTNQGRVVLLDFGVATELGRRARDVSGGGSGEVVGTARYMAPEQVDEGPPTPAADWYSVGVMLYEALVGRAPFVGAAVDVLTMKSTVDPTAPSLLVAGVPQDLDALCMALLHREPSMRPTGEQVLQRLGVRRSSRPPPMLAGANEAGAAFIGREQQLATLREAFNATFAGVPVTVKVGGAPGMGKSTIVHHFLDELAERDHAVVLSGRAYEREAVPYKAVDGVMDALSHLLVSRIEGGDDVALPEDIWALARLFPVLRRIPDVEEAAKQERAEDPRAVRRRAFEALRALFVTLARRQPLAIFLDDVQWGDVDSASLLLEVLRGPEVPPVLVLMTFRDGEAAAKSPFLLELNERWPEGVRVVDVMVGPLEPPDATRLAASLLGGTYEETRRVAAAIAREGRGSPFLIEELARAQGDSAGTAGQTLKVPTLHQMIADRVARVPENARRLIEVIAVGGRPLPVAVVGAAAGVQERVNETVAFLGARRFARIGQRDGREVVEATHDRIRETILELTPPAVQREHHGALARALETFPGADAEAIAAHWLGAGDAERAVRFAEQGAERAGAKLAFDHAARLVRLALEHTPPSSEKAQELRVRLAEALQQGGRYDESGRAYLEAARAASPEKRLEFQRAASEQLLTAGRIEEGEQVLHAVLAAIGMRAPRSQLAAVLRLVLYRLWIRILGLRFVERESSEVAREDRIRVDALFTASMGFAIVNVVLGACMQARHLIEALRRGDRSQVLRATALEAAHLCAGGGPVSAREQKLFAIATGLAEREGTPEAKAYVHGARGIGLYQRGRWHEAREALEKRMAVPNFNDSGLSSVRIFVIYTYRALGDFAEAGRRMAKALLVAREQGDLYTQVNLSTGTAQLLAMAKDDPEGGRRIAREALAQWPQRGFFVQHWQAVAYSAEVDLYVGDGAGAYERLKQAMPRLKKSFLLRAVMVRAMTWYVLGRAAIASLPSSPADRAERLAEARSMAQRLEKEADAWPKSLAAQVRACIANAEGDRAEAIAELRLALARVEGDGGIFTWHVNHKLGLLLGGDEGRAMAVDALETMKRQGVRNPERWSAVYMPGEWPPLA